MSEENVARFIDAIDAFNRLGSGIENLDPEALGEWLGLMDPEIRFEPQQAALQGTYVGREGAMQWLADLAEHYEAGQVKYDEIHDLGDRVLGLGAIHIVGRGSSIETDVPAAILMTFRNGRITRLQDFGGDKARALDAAGLGGV
jgi:ketosteroid isomerase-like protein